MPSVIPGEHSATGSLAATTRRRRCCLPSLSGEVLGLCYINVAIGSIMMGNVFYSAALLGLARSEAGCTDSSRPCEAKVHGMNPNSLLTNIGWMGGLAVAVTLPLVGAITDFTPYRRQLGIASSVILVIMNAVQIGTTEDNWWPMAILQIVAFWPYLVMSSTSGAYIPELTDDIDKQAEYNSTFAVCKYTSTTICTLFILFMSNVIPGVDDLDTARIGQATLVFVCICFLSISWWRLMKNKPSADVLPEGSSFLFIGFKKIYCTCEKVWTKYKAIKWFFIYSMFSGAGELGVVSTFVTVNMAVLGMSATQASISAFAAIVATIPGALCSRMASKKTDPLKSIMIATFLLIVVSAAAAGALSSPDRQIFSYIFAVLWGIGLGWGVTSRFTFFSTTIPSGAPAEFYGTLYFVTMVLAWVPPLTFSILNENGANLQWGIASFAFLFLFALVTLIPIGGYEEALAQVQEKIEESVSEALETGQSVQRRRSSIAVSLRSSIAISHSVQLNSTIG